MNTMIRLQYDKSIKDMHNSRQTLNKVNSILKRPFNISNPLNREQRAKVLTSYEIARDRWSAANADIQRLEKLLKVKITHVDPEWQYLN